MYCTLREKAKEWDLSKNAVRQLCMQGVIPTAERFPGIRWRIPANCPKPPMSRHGLCFLLDSIYQFNDGATFDMTQWGYSIEQIKDGYEYLISLGFMTPFNWDNKEEELPLCRVTQRGSDLITRANNEGDTLLVSKIKQNYSNVNSKNSSKSSSSKNSSSSSNKNNSSNKNSSSSSNNNSNKNNNNNNNSNSNKNNSNNNSNNNNNNNNNNNKNNNNSNNNNNSSGGVNVKNPVKDAANEIRDNK